MIEVTCFQISTEINCKHPPWSSTVYNYLYSFPCITLVIKQIPGRDWEKQQGTGQVQRRARKDQRRRREKQGEGVFTGRRS